MNIIVLMQQMPDMTQLSAGMNGSPSMETDSQVINSWDECAVEEGLRLREAYGGSVTLLCLGKPDAKEVLKRGLSMGADEAVLISDPLLADSDNLAMARVLVAALNKVDAYNLVIASRSFTDGGNFATVVQVAALLNIPQLSYVAAINAVDPHTNTITVEKLVETGPEIVSSKLPVVMSLVKKINEPRYPSFMQIRKAAKKSIPTWGVVDLGLEVGQVGAAGSRIKWSEIELPSVRETQVETIDGTPTEVAKVLVDRLLAEKII